MFNFNPLSFPESPGVYRMLDSESNVIYIGKAINLRKRLSQYFKGGHDGRYQFHLLLRDVETVEVVTVGSEKDALILENQMIKREKPRYNIRLKDDKTYPYIRLSKDKFPRVEVSRERGDDDYDVFGPYTSPATAHRLVELISRQFGVRRCPGIPLALLERECLYAQIGQCSAPCVGKVSEDSYSKDVDRARGLLSGKTKSMIRDSKEQMEMASERLDFEQAAYFRDLWKALRQFERGGVIEGGGHDELDVISCASQGGWHLVALIQVRNGELWSHENFEVRAIESWEEQAGSFIVELYSHRSPSSRIVVDFDLNEINLISQLLNERADRSVVVTQPQRGMLRSWLTLARQNARAELSCRRATGSFDESGYLEIVQKECRLPNLPKMAIALDCANFSKEEPVGTVVVFRNGKADKKSYRKFKVRGDIAELGDIHHIEEVLGRYLKRFAQEQWPDAILIDGGREQLAAAARAITKLGRAPDRALIAISKGDQRKSGDEQLHFFGDDETLDLKTAPLSMPLWTELRDEAHRTSNSFNGRRLKSSRLKDPFAKLPGIGSVSAKRLRSVFGSMSNFLSSDAMMITNVKGLSRRQKETLLAYHRSNQQD